MRDPERIPKMTALLEELWRANPDQRLGQLVSNLARGLTSAWPDIFQVEDDELMQRLQDVLEHGWEVTFDE